MKLQLKQLIQFWIQIEFPPWNVGDKEKATIPYSLYLNITMMMMKI